MSLITRCPACSTMFKVVPDQLRISQGWVRCGHCDEVFDASAHMLTAQQQAALLAPTEPMPLRAGADTPAIDAAAVPEARQPSHRSSAGASAPHAPAAWSPAHTETVAWQTLAPTEASLPETPATPAPAATSAPPAWTEERLATGVEAASVQVPAWQAEGDAAGSSPAAEEQAADAPVARAAASPREAETPHTADDARREPWHAAPPALSAPATADARLAASGDTPPGAPFDARQEPVSDLDAAPPAVDAVLAASPSVSEPALARNAARLDAAPPPPPSVDLPSRDFPAADADAEKDVAADDARAVQDAAAEPAADAVPPSADRLERTPSEPPPEAPAEQSPEPSSADGQPAPSFVADARRRAFWSSRPMRVALWLALLLLGLALLLQAALTRRDWLAAREPALAPLLQTLCRPFGCELAPYRLLDAIVIDSSSFNRATAGGFRFSVTLRNQADMPVATPALELTLTDLQDQALVRRVLSAAELGAPPALAARGEFSANSVITLAADAPSTAVTGYRLMAFYP